MDATQATPRIPPRIDASVDSNNNTQIVPSDTNANVSGDTSDSSANDTIALDIAQDDTAQDVATDITVDAIEDIASETVHDTPLDVAEDTPLSGNITVQINSENDVVTSYLMNVSSNACNIFYGSSVPLGRHFDSTMSHVSYYTALRFTGIAIPQGAAITSSKLRFYPTNEVDSSKPLILNVYAELTANCTALDPKDYQSNRADQRLCTTAFIDRWIVRCNTSCTDITEYDCPQRKLDCWNRNVQYESPKDLKALIQEVVNLPEWKPGNAMTILIINAATDHDGNKYKGLRHITGYDPQRGAKFAPELAISFESP